MLARKRLLEREATLQRIRELDAEIAQHERNLREGEARLPIEAQLSLKPAAVHRGQTFLS